MINPFVRGYSDLRYRRVLLVTYASDCPPCYKTLHESQAALADHELQLFPCVFSDEFVLVTEGRDISDELLEQCPHNGLIRDVLYEVHAMDEGRLIHLGDTPSAESAEALIKRLTFETGRYSRSWEISSEHLPEDALQTLQTLGESSVPTGLNFECFLLTDSNSVGCKLFSTPWSEEHLQAVDGISQDQLKQQQLEAGIPQPLIDVLVMASLADVRFLVFDPSAQVLEHLPVYATA